MQLSQKPKTFSQFVSAFLKARLNLDIFNEKVTLIADVFAKLRTPKCVMKQTSKSSCFRGPFDKQHSKLDQTLLRSERHHLYHIYRSLWRQLSWKKYLLVICKLLGMFINTLTVDPTYSLLKRDNLRQPIRMQLLQKQKIFSQFFAAFLKARLNFEHFQKKMTLIAHAFWKLWTPKAVVR